jgi:hypothetical protein
MTEGSLSGQGNQAEIWLSTLEQAISQGKLYGTPVSMGINLEQALRR